MLSKRLICDNLIGGHKILSEEKIPHKPWLSKRDAVPHAPSFLPHFGDAPHLDGALKNCAEKRLTSGLLANVI